MDLFLPIILFVVGLACLIFGGDWFVDGAVGIAQRLRVPEILIGATIVSIGTTLPEVLVSTGSAAIGHGELAYGNAVGSIICNTALILAVTIAIKPAKASRNEIILPSVFFFLAAAVYVFTAYVFHEFSRFVGIILVLIFAVYMFMSVRKSLIISKEQQKAQQPEEHEPTVKKQPPLIHNIGKMVVGAALIAIGADLLVDNGTLIAESLGVPESVIGLTFVALGTSLPELVTAITSLIKGHGSLSLGNIFGANLFNLVFVSGLSVVISPFSIPAGKSFMGMNASLVIDLPLMLLVMLIVAVPVLLKNKLYRVQGIALLLLYAGFCVFQFAG